VWVLLDGLYLGVVVVLVAGGVLAGGLRFHRVGRPPLVGSLVVAVVTAAVVTLAPTRTSGVPVVEIRRVASDAGAPPTTTTSPAMRAVPVPTTTTLPPQ
jgi:hypothetical protein